MKSVETLIKLAKHKVDSVQKLILAAQKIEADLNKKIIDLDNQVEKEKNIAQANPQYASSYNDFVKSVKMQKANVFASLDGVKEQLNALAEDLRIAFEEQKKFETLFDRRQQHQLDLRKSREQKAMDEFAITRAKRA
jgi:flagellar protein FliJ